MWIIVIFLGVGSELLRLTGGFYYRVYKSFVFFRLRAFNIIFFRDYIFIGYTFVVAVVSIVLDVECGLRRGKFLFLGVFVFLGKIK